MKHIQAAAVKFASQESVSFRYACEKCTFKCICFPSVDLLAKKFSCANVNVNFVVIFARSLFLLKWRHIGSFLFTGCSLSQ